MKEICATLMLMCSPFIQNFSFEYGEREEFVYGIAECTIFINEYWEGPERLPVLLSVAQAALESNWGESRFAKEAKNYYGIRQTDLGEPHILSKNGIALRKYDSRCMSVEDYISLLNTSHHYKLYRQTRLDQYVVDQVNIDELIDTLTVYAEDPEYKNKLKTLYKSINKKYFGQNQFKP